jgi:hypothetical protein
MSGPFSNADDGELFIANRCARCTHRLDPDLGFGEPCDDFTPAYLGKWPTILTRVPVDDRNPIGVECTRFQVTW